VPLVFRNGAVPATPASGRTTLYADTSDQRIYYKTDAGTVIGPLGPSGTGTVTSTSVVTANGFAGTVATATTTPAITLTTSITGILQGNGTAISAASTTGSGSVVLATSPTLVTPALGTPTALVGTNITGTASGLTAGATTNVTSGTYTPTLTAVTNVAASTAYVCQYMRVGSVVTVSGKLDIDPTAALTTQLGISLPIASNFSGNGQCGGVGAVPSLTATNSLQIAVVSDATNDRAEMEFVTTFVDNRTVWFTFTYLII
jgi:hypothetical protein